MTKKISLLYVWLGLVFIYHEDNLKAMRQEIAVVVFYILKWEVKCKPCYGNHPHIPFTVSNQDLKRSNYQCDTILLELALVKLW